LNNKCPITVIFGTISSQSVQCASSKDGINFPPHLSSATALH